MARVFKDDKGILTVMNNIIKVALLCEFSNPEVQKKLQLKMTLLEKILRKIKKKNCNVYELTGEYNIFITNAIKEYEKHNDSIELHVLASAAWLRTNIQEFELNGIYYHFFKDERKNLLNIVKSHAIRKLSYSRYKKNRKNIINIISKISPDFIYMSGAENPSYGLAVLDVPKTIPVLVHLQTLLNDSSFEKNYPISHSDYLYRAGIELEILKRVDFIGTNVTRFIDIIRKQLVPNAKILKTRLAVGEDIEADKNIEKKYDFVYFSANISKAFDLALEGFAVARNTKPEITLHVVGAYSDDYKNKIDERIQELNLQKSITFTGRLPTHNDVITEIQKARFALLPLKIDITSGTIREAFACELPVVTTITENGTPRLNEKRETVLLSEIGDHKAIADNMIRLCNDNDLAEELKLNGRILMNERYSNSSAVDNQIQCIKEGLAYFKNGTPVTEEIIG